jgi:hypothetical protein
MKKIKLTETQLKRLMTNEQLLKNIGDKIKSGIQNVVNKVNGEQNKEVTQPGTINKGRDLEQLRAEWSKINQDISNMNGYGEAVGQTENATHTSAMMKAKAAILKKLGKPSARFGAVIKEEALFKLENGNFIKLVVIEMTKVWDDGEKLHLNEEISKIKSMMGIRENEEITIPPDVMQSIEAEADQLIAKSQQERKDIEELIKRIEVAAKEHGNEMFQSLLDDNRRKLNSFYTIEDKPRIVNSLIAQYRQAEVYKKYEQERVERAKTAKITADQIVDVFVTAIEGGSNYWYYILDIPNEVKQIMKSESLAFSEACGKYVLNGGELIIYDVEEVGEMDDVDEFSTQKPEPLGHINMDSLLDAINVMKRDFPEMYENIVMDEYDAEDADVFFQIATMGEVVYG